MKLDLGKLSSVLANLGVIVGIAFLAFEIRQSNLIAKSQARSEIATTTAELTFLLAMNPEFAELVYRAGTEPESWNSVERSRIDTQLGAVLRLWENAYYQYRNDLLDEIEYLAERETMRTLINSPLYFESWCNNFRMYSADFRQEMASLIENGSCETGEYLIN